MIDLTLLFIWFIVIIAIVGITAFMCFLSDMMMEIRKDERINELLKKKKK